MIVNVLKYCGDFAENKDTARELREKVRPICTNRAEIVILDFTGVDSSTQSFIHALISGFFQEYGEEALNLFEFKGCSKAVKSLITTVINYSLD